MVFNLISLPALVLLALVSARRVVANAEAKVYPEIIPGPGLPSLASLGLTSKDLFEGNFPGLTDRNITDEAATGGKTPLFNRVCYDNGCGRTRRNDAQGCINYLYSLGTTYCTVYGDYVGASIQMCTVGAAHVTGTNVRGGGYVSSYCQDVARGGQNVIDYCSDGAYVAGADAAYGNGDLIVSIENC